MSRPLPTPEELYSCAVHDSSGQKVGGKVEMVWVDELSSQPEFVGVNTNWLLKGKVHPIPLVEATVEQDVVQVPYSGEQIKGAPDIGTDVELTPELEAQLYGYYGLERPSGVGATSRPEGSGLDDDSIVMPGTFNALTGDAQTLAEAAGERGGVTSAGDESAVAVTASAEKEAPRLRRVAPRTTDGGADTE